jgi:hypothetical protein
MVATNDRTVTVFGGTGFLGRRIVRDLRSRGFPARIASRHPDRGHRLFGPRVGGGVPDARRVDPQDMLPPKWKMLLCQWQMSEAEERRRLFEDEIGRNFGQHAGETSLSFESFAERRRRERFLEPQ